MSLSLLVVEDDEALCRAIDRHVGRRGIAARFVSTLAEAKAALAARSYDAVLVDVGLPDGPGTSIFDGITQSPPPAIIVMTGDATVEVAVGALRLGAIDFLMKPFSMAALDAAISRVMAGPLESIRPGAHAEDLDGWRRRYAPALLGRHPSLLAMFSVLSKTADAQCAILIQGETGTGKELVARAIHAASPRSGNGFVAVNCAAMPEHLIESELFGHSRGAFTGAVTARTGRFADADRGTLFLDEIGEMPLPVQAKLLRVLQEKEFSPVGESRRIKVDVRILAATHRDLERMVAAGKFREDLFYRLDVVRVVAPPLRDRRSDIPLLAMAFLESACARTGRKTKGIDEAALASLSAYQWPGNVRQLENVIERMVLIAGDHTLHVEDLPPSIAGARPQAEREVEIGRPRLPEEGIDLREAVARFESALIEQALERAGGNQTRAALILRMSRTTLSEKLRKRDGS